MTKNLQLVDTRILHKRTSLLQPTGCSSCLHNWLALRWTDSRDFMCSSVPNSSTQSHGGVSLHVLCLQSPSNPWCIEGRGTSRSRPREMEYVYPKHTVHATAGHVNKQSMSASLLIPSAGRDKLSPLMKSFHRLHAGREPVYVYCTESWWWHKKKQDIVGSLAEES